MIPEVEEELNVKRNSWLKPGGVMLALAVGVLLGYYFAVPERTYHVLSQSASGFKLKEIISYVGVNYVDTVNVSRIEEEMIPVLLKKLDPHSTYIPSKDVQRVTDPLEGNFSGIGVEFGIQRDSIVIVDVIKGGPSEDVGLLPGDRIVEADGKSLSWKGISSRDVSKLLKGADGSVVKIGIWRSGEDSLMFFDIKRGMVPFTSIDAALMATPQVGYVKIERFARTTYDEFQEAVTRLKKGGMSKMILDLRYNTGGYLDAAIDIADEFLPFGKLVVYTEGRSRRKREYYSTEKGNCEDLELIILINSWSASASEIVAGAIQDNDRGLILGVRSYGKGLVQEPVAFFDGSLLRLTTARYYTPTGRCIQKTYQNGVEAYNQELSKRIKHGELFSRDSVHFIDSLRYETAMGRVVYGGGGIMPDVFVPADTTGLSSVFYTISEKGLLSKFALRFADNNREIFQSLATGSEIEQECIRLNILKQFESFLAARNITFEQNELENSKDFLEALICANVVRNFLGSEGYYPIYFRVDAEYKKAIQIFDKGKIDLKEYNSKKKL